MLKRLRLKFVLITMMIVTLMLGVIFGLLYFSTKVSLERESMQMLGTVAMEPLKLGRPGGPQEDVRLPYFSVLINRAGEATDVGGGFFDLSDQAFLDSLVKATFETHTDSGILPDYNLRFLCREMPMGHCIVYADLSSEQSTLHNLIRTFLAVGSAAFLAFLGLTILLARWSVKPVERAWQQQKQFIADASHELKTPLTVITTAAELLHAQKCPEEDRIVLSSNIMAMSGQMRGLVESMLELARVESNASRAEFTEVSLSEIVAQTVMQFEPLFFERGMMLQSQIAPDVTVRGAEPQLRQLADILLDNAQKYACPGGKTEVCLKCLSPRHCLLEVSDQGEPIPGKELKNLFKRFYRADQARSMNHSYGLGLSIAQSIAETHHGRIWAESREGWNRFFVELPVSR